MYVTYKDYPSIPESLLSEAHQSLLSQDIFTSNLSVRTFGNYIATPKLQEWFRDTMIPLIGVDDIVNVQTIISGIPIHKDRNRNLALNYIIDPGGADVITSFYEDQVDSRPGYCLVPVEEYKIIPHVWHELRTDVFHGVSGLTSKRIAVSFRLL